MDARDWYALVTAATVLVLAVWLAVRVIRLNAMYKSEDYDQLKQQMRSLWLPLGLFEISVGMVLISTGSWTGAPTLMLLGVGMIVLWRVYPRIHPE